MENEVVLMYSLLNVFFFVFHTTFILFVLFGWIWEKARKIHFAAVMLTAFSWFGLGIFYGFGYCFCTEWHWNVRYRLGYVEMPRSYIKFLILSATGWDLNDDLVDAVTVGVFIAIFALTVFLAVVKRRKETRS